MPLMTTTIEMVEMQCGNCGTYHAIPKAMYDSAVEEGGFWNCPNGHSRGFKDGRRAREAVQRERDLLKQQLAQRDDDIREITAKLHKQESKVTRMKKRAAAGVCPCCNRQFQNLHLHMQSKHKDYATNVVILKTAS